MQKIKRITLSALILVAMLALLFIVFKKINTPKINWNDQNITWYEYDNALQIAGDSNRKVILIFYADWCPTCKKFGKLFSDDKLVELTRKFIMVRENVDVNPVLNKKFSFNGTYIPRIFVLDSKGNILEQLYDKNTHRYLVDWSSPEELVTLMEAAEKLN